MKPIDIILIVALAVIVIGIIAYLIVKKKKGETSCGCACSGCPSAGACAAVKKTSQNHENKPKEDTHV